MPEKNTPEGMLDEVELNFSQQTGMVKAVAGGIFRPLVKVLRGMLGILRQLSDENETLRFELARVMGRVAQLEKGGK